MGFEKNVMSHTINIKINTKIGESTHKKCKAKSVTICLKNCGATFILYTQYNNKIGME